MYKYTYVYYASSPRQEKLFIWPPFFQYNKRLLSQKTGGACVYMPQDAGHWLANFEVIPPFPPKASFSAAKKRTFQGMRTAFEKNLRHIFFFYFLAVLSKILSHRSRLSQTTSDPAQKNRKFQAKIAFFCFSGEHFGTILSRRSRLSRTSRAPSRLIRPHPIVCDRRSEQTVNSFPVFGQFFFEHLQKKVVLSDPRSISDDLHPKRSP